jgi:hypothetical protein
MLKLDYMGREHLGMGDQLGLSCFIFADLDIMGRLLRLSGLPDGLVNVRGMSCMHKLEEFIRGR